VAVLAAVAGGAACGDGGAPVVTDDGGGALDDAEADGGADGGEAGPDATSEDEVSALELTVLPERTATYPGAGALLLAEVVVTPPGAEVALEATSDPVVALEVMPHDATGAGVREVLFRPAAGHVGSSIAVHVTGRADGRERTATMTVDVVDWDDAPEPMAATLRDAFVAYLATRHPELGIDASTTWEDLGFPSPVLIVSHRVFLSADWELGLAWHNTIAPDDWAEAYLRRRSEMAPSWAARIASVSTDPTAITDEAPPATVRR
jgi:hypothetical protein